MNINNNINVFKTRIRNSGKNKSKSLSKGKKNYKTHLSVLEKTYDISMNILQNFYRSIKKIYLKKKELVNIIKENKFKIINWITNICRKKRKYEEIKEYYDEKTMENIDNIDEVSRKTIAKRNRRRRKN